MEESISSKFIFMAIFLSLKKMMYKYIGNYFTVPIIAQAQMPVIRK